MIEYKCRNPKCGAVLESPDELAGASETCPDCGAANTVPPKGPPVLASPSLQPTAAPPAVPTPPAIPAPPPVPAGPAAVATPPPAGPPAAGRPARCWRVPSVVSLPAGGLLVLLFFMPWVGIQCSGVSASGLQLSVGSVSVDTFLGVPVLQGPGLPQPDKVRARPWFFLGLLVPLAIGTVALLGMVRKMKPSPLAVSYMALGAVGVLIMILVAGMDYSDAERGVEAGAVRPDGSLVTGVPPSPSPQPGSTEGPEAVRAPAPSRGLSPASPRRATPAPTPPMPQFPFGPGMMPGVMFRAEATNVAWMCLLLNLTVLIGGIGQILHDRLRKPPGVRPGRGP